MATILGVRSGRGAQVGEVPQHEQRGWAPQQPTVAYMSSISAPNSTRVPSTAAVAPAAPKRIAEVAVLRYRDAVTQLHNLADSPEESLAKTQRRAKELA